MIQQALAPVGAIVTECAMVDGSREIDVLIEAAIGPYKMKVAVEAKDEKRALDIGFIEQMIGKYLTPGGIPVNQVVAVARNGFTKKAQDRANQVGIKLFVLDRVTQSDWTKLVAQAVTFRMAPRLEKVELVPPITPANGKNPLRDGHFVCTCHGTDQGSPLQWAQWFLVHNVFPNLGRLQAEAQKRNGDITLLLSHPMVNTTLLLDGEHYPVGQLKLAFRFIHGPNSAQWSSYKLSERGGTDKTVDEMECVLGPTRMRVVFPEGPTSPQVVIRFDKAEPPGQPGPAENIVLCSLPTALRPINMPAATIREPTQEKCRRREPQPAQPVQRSEKVRRNDPCPCGSPRKFKNCCLRKGRSGS